MHVNRFPRTLSAGDPYIVPSSTSGSARPISRTISNVTFVLGISLYIVGSSKIISDRADSALLHWQTGHACQHGIDGDEHRRTGGAARGAGKAAMVHARKAVDQ